MAELLKPISPDKVDNVNHWSLPDMAGKETIPAKTKLTKNIRAREKSKPVKDENEVIEDVVDDELQGPITAQELEKITEDAKKDGYEKGYQEGHDKGHEEGVTKGLQEGKDKGLAETTKDIQEKMSRIQSVIDALLIPVESERKQLEQRLCEIIAALTTLITKKTLEEDSSIVVTCVEESLSHLEKSRDKVTLYLSEKDSELIKSHLSDSDWNIQYQIDESLIPGGCRVETETSAVDFSIENQLSQVIQQFVDEEEV